MIWLIIIGVCAWFYFARRVFGRILWICALCAMICANAEATYFNLQYAPTSGLASIGATPGRTWNVIPNQAIDPNNWVGLSSIQCIDFEGYTVGRIMQFENDDTTGETFAERLVTFFIVTDGAGYRWIEVSIPGEPLEYLFGRYGSTTNDLVFDLRDASRAGGIARISTLVHASDEQDTTTPDSSHKVEIGSGQTTISPYPTTNPTSQPVGGTNPVTSAQDFFAGEGSDSDIFTRARQSLESLDIYINIPSWSPSLNPSSDLAALIAEIAPENSYISYVDQQLESLGFGNMTTILGWLITGYENALSYLDGIVQYAQYILLPLMYLQLLLYFWSRTKWALGMEIKQATHALQSVIA